MIRSIKNYQLKKHNTFNIHSVAKYYFEFTEKEDLLNLIQTKSLIDGEKVLIIGEGSNLLFIGDFDGIIIYPNIPGIKLVHEDRNNVWLEVGSGVNWDQLVEFAVYKGFGGIENLSGIPGKTGAAAVQNIGAYGVELESFIESVTGIDLLTKTEYTINRRDCAYAYRDSIFKNELSNRFVITGIVIKLDKFPDFKLNYSNLKAETEKTGIINLKSIRQAVIGIRNSKLPDSKITGNAGSFFKNPEVSNEIAIKLAAIYPEIPIYRLYSGKIKLAAAWLIEQCGWKAYRNGDAGVHDKQALVLVNHGNASGKEIFDLSEQIKRSVFEKFGINLEREVMVI